MGKIVTIDTEALGISWQPNRQYRIAIDQGFVKEDGNNQSPNPANTNLNTFTTNADGPSISSSTPTDGDTNAISNAVIAIVFNRRIKVGTGDIRLYDSSNTVLKTWTVTSGTDLSISDQTLSLTITGLVEEGGSYYLQADAGSITDRDGFDYAGISNTTDYNWTNSTGPEFPGLAANLSGAFIPTMTVNAQRVAESILSAPFTMSVNAGRVIERSFNLQVTASITGPAFTFLFDSTMNSEFNIAVETTALKPFSSSLSTSFNQDTFVSQIPFTETESNPVGTPYLEDWPASGDWSGYHHSDLDDSYSALSHYISANKIYAIGKNNNFLTSNLGDGVSIYKYNSGSFALGSNKYEETNAYDLLDFETQTDIDSLPSSTAQFGFRVSMDASGANAVIYNNIGTGHGRFYFLSRSGSTWSANGTLSDGVSMTTSNDYYAAHTVQMSGDGAYMVASNGVRTIIFKQTSGVWAEQQTITVASTQASIDSGGNRVVLQYGTNNVLVYSRSSSTWSLESTITLGTTYSRTYNNSLGIMLNSAGNRFIVDSQIGSFGSISGPTIQYDYINSNWVETNRIFHPTVSSFDTGRRPGFENTSAEQMGFDSSGNIWLGQDVGQSGAKYLKIDPI